MTHDPAGVLWVCDVCLFAAESDVDIREPGSTEPEPWCRELDTDVTVGLMWSEHVDPVACQKAFESGEGCNCDEQEFSKSPCDGCGKHLHGHRNAYTAWVAA